MSEEQKKVQKRNVKQDLYPVRQSSLPLAVPTNFEDQQKFFEVIAKGNHTSVKTPGAAILVYETARSLNINWATSFQKMHVIKEKITLGMDIIKSVLSRPSNYIRWERTKNFKELYWYIDSKGNQYWEENLPEDAIIVSYAEFKEHLKGKKEGIVYTINRDSKKGLKPEVYNWITEYKFIRAKKNHKGEWYEVEEISSFSWFDALAAKLPLNQAGQIDPNSAWSKYRKRMLDHRAFKFGAYDIAADLLMGCDEITEVLDVEGINYDFDDEGDVQIIDISNDQEKA